jgi:hypothetical protein
MNPDSHALTPGAPNLAQPHLDDEVVATPELTRQEQKEKDLAALTDHPGWLPFTDKVHKQIDDLRTMKTADLQGKSYEQVGQMFLVASLAADKLEAALEMVETTAKQVQINASESQK